MPRVEDVAWKYVDRFEGKEKKWRCRYCGREYNGSVKRVKAHLGREIKEGVKLCPQVPDDVRDLMRSLLKEEAEEGSRQSNHQSSLLHDMSMPRQAVHQDVPLTQPSLELGGPRLPMPRVVADPANFTYQLTSNQQLQGEHQFHWSSITPSLAQNKQVASSTSQTVFQRHSALNPNDKENWNPPGCTQKFLSFYGQTGIATASVCPQDQVSLHPGNQVSLHPGNMLSEAQAGVAEVQLPPRRMMDSSDRGVFEERIQGNVRAAPTSTSHLPNVEGGNNLESPQGVLQEMLQEESDDPLNELLIDEQLDSHMQILKDIINTMDPSTSEGTPNGAPTGVSSFQNDRTIVLHSNEPLPSCNKERETETSSYPLRESMDICSLTATHVDFQFLEGEANMAGTSSYQASVAPQRPNVPHQSTNFKAAQNPTGSSSAWGVDPVTCHPPPPLDMAPCIPSSSQAPNNAPPPPPIPPCGTDLIGPSSSPDMNGGAPMASQANTVDNFEKNGALKRKLENLYGRVAGIRDELEFAASLSVENRRREVENWLPDAEKFIKDYTQAASKGCLPPHEVNKLKRKSEDLLRQGKFPKGLFEAREIKVSKFLEGKMVGEAFKRNITKILEYLVGNQVSRLGIYGMGGVGKTTIMEHIHNRLLEKANYGNVLWITVSKDFNTRKLQDDIWNALGLGTLQQTDMRKRASMLHDGLMERGKCTIILDDVWEPFDLELMGIPIRADGFQLALTTRSFDVCHQMQCQENIKIEHLSQEEAESLFLEELGSEGALSLEIKTVVKSIVEECAGLPLGVITIARSMRGVTELFIWKDFLVKLKESSVRKTDVEKKVLMKLKFSYDRLGNHQVQQCFLSCALYPEDELIAKYELIELFIDQGLIGGLDTREQQYDRGLTILSILENVCLLEDHGSKMKMHDLIRDMALHIIGATSMVKARKQLTRIPSEECWTDALERVSLMDNCIEEFPLNMSPNCPKLSTLLLNHSLGQVYVIPDSFFQKLRGLEVLNLSWCIDLSELPNSISDLVNLRALLLRNCCDLRHIPSVAKLTALRKLDAKGCIILEEIKGLEMLVNLTYLDLFGTRIKSLPKETLRHLLKLQYLKVSTPIEEDITYLGALETLECWPRDANDFNKCVRVIGQRNIRSYDLTVNPRISFYERYETDDDDDEDPIFNLDKIIAIEEWSHAIVSVGEECAGNFILIPRDVQKLRMRNCGGRTNLAGTGPLKCLEELIIEGEMDLRVLCGGQDEEGIDIRDSPATIPSPPLFPSLRRLEISFCSKLKHLIGYGSNFPLPHLREIHISHCHEMEGIMATVASPPPCPNPAFPSLEKIEVSFCGKMKRVVESEWLPHFPNLREIAVELCENMEEIIGGPPPNMTVGEIPLESLEVTLCDKMRMLFTHEWLIHLRNLQRIRVNYCKEMVEMINSGAGQGQEGSTRSEAGQSQGGSIMTPVTDTSSWSSISLPKLTHLQLYNLPRLQSICEVSVTCDSIENIRVGTCPELKGIPLQLRLRNIEDLPYIWVDNEETWNMLTWDHPDTQATLQSYLRKGKEVNEKFMSWGTKVWSSTAIGNELIDIIASLLKLHRCNFSVCSHATLTAAFCRITRQGKGSQVALLVKKAMLLEQAFLET